MSDDAYGQFQCDNDFWDDNHINFFRADGGNLLLAVTRAGSFLLMFALNFYNRTLLSRKAANNVNVVRGLILPSYLPYVYCYCALNLAGALLATILNAKVTDTTRANSWIIPIEIAFAHWLSEGLALFLIGFGAGIRAIRRALAVSGVWGLFTAAYYFILLSYLTNRYELGKQDPDVARNRLFAMFFAYICSLLSFYLWFAFVPPEITYHRPALKFYARFYLCSYTMNLVIGICLYERVYDAVCPSSVLLYVVAAFLQPLAIFRTLQYDSQYWQGLRPNDGNPVAEAFDHLGLDTADSMAASLSNFAQDRMGLPIIHFGHLKIKNDFVAGGFSRVYFGTYKGKEVAFKIVYAMELSPSDVQEFYREATVLAQLQHECVVKCMGICVMPPALSLVLELCEYGALFDFLYKPCREVRKGSRVASESSMQSRGSIARALQEASELDVPVTGSIRNSKKSILRPSSARGSSLVSGSMRRTDDTSEGGSRNSARVRISTPHTSILRDRNSSNPEFISNPLTTINDIEAGELSGEIKNDSPSGVNIVRESFNIEGSDEVMQSKRASTKEPVGPATRLSFFNRISESKTGRSSDTHDDKDQKHSSRLSVNSDEENRPPRQSMAARFMGSMRISFARSYGVSSNYQAETILKPHIFFVNDLDRIKMMADCANAIAFLHSKGYMHCDIKSLNFLVSSVSSLKTNFRTFLCTDFTYFLLLVF